MFDPFTDKSTYTAIRKHSAAHDIYNRLHSIARDTEFVDRVSSSYQGMVVVRESLSEGREEFTLTTRIANQRCGVWYCDPEVSTKGKCRVALTSNRPRTTSMRILNRPTDTWA